MCDGLSPIRAPGWAFSRDGGRTWTHGLLPGLTPYSTPPGPEKSVADTTVAWNAKYHKWVVSALNCNNPGGNAVAVLPFGLPPATQKFNEPMEAVAGGEPIKAQSP